MNMYNYFKEWLYLKKKSIQLTFAIWLCDLKQKAFNRRYFVILGSNDKLLSFCKRDIDKLKRLNFLDKHMSHLDLMENSFYYTALSLNGNGISLEERMKKRKKYLDYVRLIKKLHI